MKYISKLEYFIYTEMFSDGFKTAIAAVIPPLVLGYFGYLFQGSAIAFGVVITHVCDIPSTIKQRRIFMLLSILLIFITSFFVKTFNESNLFIYITLPIVMFSMSMLAVYGQHATNLGMSVMLAYVLSLPIIHEISPIENSLLIALGGFWYMFVSLSLSTFRPYRMSQQALADCMNHIAQYIKIKSQFFEKDLDYDKVTKELLEEQIIINSKQDLVRELVFNNKKIVKDTNVIGRFIVFVFSDLNDIFDSANVTYFEYKNMNEKFGNDEVFRQINKICNNIAYQLQNIAYHINVNTKPEEQYDFKNDLSKLKDQINLYDKKETKQLRLTYGNLKRITQKLNFIHKFLYDKNFKDNNNNPHKTIHKFVTPQDYKLKKLKDHLNLKSSFLRHALRLSIVMVLGFSVTFFLPDSTHGYWLLLTILVIMKPGFSVTKTRNSQRLIGTVAGGIIGVLVVFFVTIPALKFAIMFILMLLAYAYIRHIYVIGTLYMTAYVLIALSFLSNSGNDLHIVNERLLDTFIGGAMAFVSSYILFPSWESSNIKETLQNALIADYEFIYEIFIILITKESNITNYKLARKNVYLNMANVTSIFQRVISEPKKTQINAKELNRLTVFNHSFIAYSSAIFDATQRDENIIIGKKQIDEMTSILKKLNKTIQIYGEYTPENNYKDLITLFNNYYKENIQENLTSDNYITDMLKLTEEIIFDLNKASIKIKM